VFIHYESTRFYPTAVCKVQLNGYLALVLRIQEIGYPDLSISLFVSVTLGIFKQATTGLI
jgi:hypothetical protein